MRNAPDSKRQQLNEVDGEEVAVNAAPHLSGVAALRPARLKGERRELGVFTERGGGERRTQEKKPSSTVCYTQHESVFLTSLPHLYALH
ncbi:hypothetical protein PAMP_005590 [Pampus punctatissimus]